jgi:hypothetical protein
MSQQLSEKDRLESHLSNLRKEFAEYEKLLVESTRRHLGFTPQGKRCFIGHLPSVLCQEEEWNSKLEQLERKIEEVKHKLRQLGVESDR